AGTVTRTLTPADLNIPYDEAGADAQRAAPPSGGPDGCAVAVNVGTRALPAPAAARPSALSPGQEWVAAAVARLLAGDSPAAVAHPAVGPDLPPDSGAFTPVARPRMN